MTARDGTGVGGLENVSWTGQVDLSRSTCAEGGSPHPEVCSRKRTSLLVRSWFWTATRRPGGATSGGVLGAQGSDGGGRDVGGRSQKLLCERLRVRRAGLLPAKETEREGSRWAAERGVWNEPVERY